MPYTDSWCTDEDHRRIAIATSFPFLVEIAKEVITRNRKPSRPVMQVCGPMASGGGTLEANTEAIARAIAALRRQGYVVFSQVTFRRGMLNFTTLEDYRRNPLRLLDQFYGKLFRGGYIQALAFLPRWDTSLGCRWECDIGKKLGMGIMYLPEHLD